METPTLEDLWRVAARDLGLDIETPFSLGLASDVSLTARVLVRGFGGEKGTLVFTDSSALASHGDRVCELGYGYSVLSEALPTETYVRDEYIELLSDWGWCGATTERPAWLLPA